MRSLTYHKGLRHDIHLPLYASAMVFGINGRSLNNPKTHEQVERLNRTLEEATTKMYYDQDKEELDKHLQAFIWAYNVAKRLSNLKYYTPAEAILTGWKNPKLFCRNSLRQPLKLNNN